MENKKMSGAKLPWMYYDDNGIPIDPDIGYLSPEDKLKVAEMFKAAMPKARSEWKDRVIIIGTGGSLEGNDISKIFYNPDNWKLKDE